MIKNTLMVALVAAGLGSTAAAQVLIQQPTPVTVQPPAVVTAVDCTVPANAGAPTCVQKPSLNFPNIPVTNLAPVIGAVAVGVTAVITVAGKNSTSTTGTN